MKPDNNHRLSVRAYQGILNQPLFDGDCSQEARRLLADGKIESAIAEWNRLADLGSGNARCVLAYIHFRGAPTIAPDLLRAKALANSATSTSRGYAYYLLGCFALAEGGVTQAVDYFKIAHEAKFVPVLTLLAWIRFRHNAVNGNDQGSAERLALLAIKAGHVPACALLARIRSSGQLGLIKRLYGALSMPWCLLNGFLKTRSNVFSISCFYYSPTFKLPLFDA